MHKELLTLWPSEAAVTQCILSQAESFDQSVFLAVHQPMRFRREVVNATNAAPEVHNERALLVDFLQENPPHGSLILPIVGNSGVGKSHAVKWLYSKVSRDEKRHCIWVRKGASLKRVLEELLCGLIGPQYETLRSRLLAAREKLPPELTAKYLRSNLIQQIKESAKQVTERMGKSQADKRLKAFGKHDMLPAALEDQHLWRNHFYGNDENPSGILHRIAEHVTSDGGVDIDQRKHQFEADDFRLPETVKIADLSLEARKFFSTLGDQDNHRQYAADVANAAIDAAKRELLGLSGESLLDIFTDLRRELLNEDRELILLVEDFVVLSGLQGALLDVITAPAVRDGRQELCTMRTALAYTTGYLTHDTVLTRAGHVWHLDETIQDDEDIWPRVLNLIGSYLNAARIGQEDLREAHLAAPESDWLPVFTMVHDPEIKSAMESFGRAPNGFPLFPLNRAAIEQLTFDKYGERVCYNPRSVIKDVLRPILHQRKFFENRQFPPMALQQTLKSASVIEKLKLNCSPDELYRQMKLLAYWGGQPKAWSDLARIPRQLWLAFELSPPSVDFSPIEAACEPKVIAQRKVVAPSPVVGVVDTPSTSLDEFDRKWSPILEAWQDGTMIPQAEANRLRTDIATAILASLPNDWPGYGNLPSRDTLRDKVYLPSSRGGRGLEPSKAMVVVCTDQERANPQSSAPIRMELEAVLRFHSIAKTKGTWDYQGGEAQSARYASFVRRHRPTVMRNLCGRLFDGVDASVLEPLLSGLLVASAALDLKGTNSREVSRAFEPLFGSSEGAIPEATVDRWAKILEIFQKSRRVENGRPGPWVRELLDAVSVRQGTGNKIFAIDAAFLWPKVKKLNQLCELVDVDLSHLSGGPGKEFRTDYNDIKKNFERATQEQMDYLRLWRRRAIDFFGEDIDKEVFDKTTRDFLKVSKAEGLDNPLTIERLRKLLAEFKKTALRTALADTADLNHEKQIDRKTLSTLGRDFGRTCNLADQLREEMGATLKTQMTAISKRRDIYGGDKVAEAKNALSGELKRIEEQLDVYEGIVE